jgi:hypothetical protein
MVILKLEAHCGQKYLIGLRGFEMRDMNNNGQINIQGNLNISSNDMEEYKPLIYCSNEVLLRERPFRVENIKLEQKRKRKRFLPFCILFICSIITMCYFKFVANNNDMALFINAIISLIMGFISLILPILPNSFQKEEQMVINEIDKILLQRRVEI